jgi:hypothetical protein
MPNSVSKQASEVGVSLPLSLCRPLIDTSLTQCLSRGLPVLAAGDLNAITPLLEFMADHDHELPLVNSRLFHNNA